MEIQHMQQLRNNWAGEKQTNKNTQNKTKAHTLAAVSLPSSLKSVNFITSAMMKPFSKSVWIFPAA